MHFRKKLESSLDVSESLSAKLEKELEEAPGTQIIDVSKDEAEKEVKKELEQVAQTLEEKDRFLKQSIKKINKKQDWLIGALLIAFISLLVGTFLPLFLSYKDDVQKLEDNQYNDLIYRLDLIEGKITPTPTVTPTPEVSTVISPKTN